MSIKKSFAKGFTLIEMLLVMVIISIIIYGSIGYLQQRSAQLRIDRTSAQIQQIMNAALAYYITNSKWPANIGVLQDGFYLPRAVAVPNINSWGQPYFIAPTVPPAGAPSSLWVWTSVTGAAGATGLTTASGTANAIKNAIPFGYTTDIAGSPPNNGLGGGCANTATVCYVVGMINVPGQNLNNANAVTFAGLYKHGGCVPVPQCPLDASNTPLVPQIIVAPVSVSGLNDPGTTTVYPISSFTAYATSNVVGGTPTNTSPPFCNSNNFVYPSGQNCASNPYNGPAPANAYWRVCLQVSTERGDVSQSNTATGANAWGKNVTLMAITRCSITTENSGSTFGVYSN